jgi:hypothetical protein
MATILGNWLNPFDSETAYEVGSGIQQFTQQVGENVGGYICDVWRDKPGYLLGVESTELVNGWMDSACAEDGNVSKTLPPQPEFDGGQCPTIYQVTVNVSGTTLNFDFGPTALGPIGGVRIEPGSATSEPFNDQVILTSNGGATEQVVTSSASVGGEKLTGATITDTTTVDGSPDNCGDPPAPPVDRTPPPANILEQDTNITINNNDGTDITFPLNFVNIAPSFDASADITIAPSFDITLEDGEKIRANPDGTIEALDNINDKIDEIQEGVEELLDQELPTEILILPRGVCIDGEGEVVQELIIVPAGTVDTAQVQRFLDSANKLVDLCPFDDPENVSPSVLLQGTSGINDVRFIPISTDVRSVYLEIEDPIPDYLGQYKLAGKQSEAKYGHLGLGHFVGGEELYGHPEYVFTKHTYYRIPQNKLDSPGIRLSLQRDLVFKLWDTGERFRFK